MGRHFIRFKLLYITLIISIASAIVGALGPLKDLTKEQLHAFSWVYWAVVFFNIVVSAGNNIVAALSTPPADTEPAEPVTEPKPTPSPAPAV
jgi:hypothetical protein